VYMVSATCAGDCASVAANMARAGAEQAKMHEGSYDKIEIERDAAIEGGHEFLLKLTKGDATTRQYVVLRHQGGWAQAAQCSVLAMNDDVGRFDALSALCKGMTVKPAS
ncbi:MAG: hypothetical protein L0206_08390, partial [Actinobacteria bacterium]|nr:hypothetical protein [Actinomycetota bacterium]